MRAMMSVPPPGVKATTIRTGLVGKFAPPAWGKPLEVHAASVALASKVTRFRIAVPPVAAILFQFPGDADPRAVPLRLEDGLEHRDAVHFVAARGGERASCNRGLREMLELGALGARFRKGRDLRPAMQLQVLPGEGADLELPRVQVLDAADLGPAVRAEDLQAPGLRGGDHGAEVAGRAALEAEQHRRRVVDAEIPDGARALRDHRLVSSREADHGFDQMHAPPSHTAGGSFLAALAPVFALEAVNARAAEIALDMQELPEPPVAEHPLYFLQRGLKAPVVADRERHLVFGAGAYRGFRVPQSERERFLGEDVL